MRSEYGGDVVMDRLRAMARENSLYLLLLAAFAVAWAYAVITAPHPLSAQDLVDIGAGSPVVLDFYSNY
jgi:hypothetical protein